MTSRDMVPDVFGVRFQQVERSVHESFTFYSNFQTILTESLVYTLQVYSFPLSLSNVSTAQIGLGTL